MSASSPCILIVDDERSNINVLNELLKNDYTIKVAMNGAQVLERAVTEPKPDLILLDVIMPEMDGFEVCKQLKAHPDTAEIPIIFVTAKNSDDDEIKALELGGVDFISKPIRPAVVKVRVKNHITLWLQKRELARMHQEVLALSVTDALTGIANRRCVDDFLQQEWRRSQRSQTPLGVLMMDIDYFKPYNDHYGHQQGDQCLRQVARAIASAVHRPPDMVARYGGEEFICVLPDTDLTGVQHIGQAILDTVRALKVPHEASAVSNYISLSIGATSVIPCPNCSSKALLQVADKLLYEAKAQGRNQMIAKA